MSIINKKITVIGCGAIGGLVASSLNNDLNKITIVDVGENLKKIKNNGLKILWDDKTETIDNFSACTDNYADISEIQDYIFICTKENQLLDISKNCKKISDKKTTFVVIQNGIPWWYFFKKLDEKSDNLNLQTLDPTREIEKNIKKDQIIGGIAYPSAEILEPGIIKHIEGYNMYFGEILTDQPTKKDLFKEIFNKPKLKITFTRNIRMHIWIKALGNLSFNPISALTQTTLEELCENELLNKLVKKLMKEGIKLANSVNIYPKVTIEQRVHAGFLTGDHKTSTLQDVMNGKRVELQALIGSLLEIGKKTDCKTPIIETVYALLSGLDKNLKNKNSKINLIKL